MSAPPCRPRAEAALAVTQDTDPSPAQPSQRSAKWKWDNWSNAQSSGADTVQTQCKIVQIQCKQCEHNASLLGQSAILRSSSATKPWQWMTACPRFPPCVARRRRAWSGLMLISVWAAALQQSAVELQTKIHKDFTITDNVSTLTSTSTTSRGLLRDCEIFANLRLQL